MNALALVLVIAALHPAPGSHATGTASLRPVAGGTRAQIRLSGLMPKASARAILQAGTCTKSGASFALVARLRADASGKAHIDWKGKMSLNGPDSIIGKSVVVHEKEDDLKTDPSGNSGARQACGAIEAAK